MLSEEFYADFRLGTLFASRFRRLALRLYPIVMGVGSCSYCNSSVGSVTDGDALGLIFTLTLV